MHPIVTRGPLHFARNRTAMQCWKFCIVIWPTCMYAMPCVVVPVQWRRSQLLGVWFLCIGLAQTGVLGCIGWVLHAVHPWPVRQHDSKTMPSLQCRHILRNY